MLKFKLKDYLSENGHSPFNEWLTGLRDLQARARVRTRLDRVRIGNLGDYVSVGDGVFELRIFYGPGYRVYFGQDGDRLVILLCGGDKKTQRKDIDTAKAYWQDYQQRKTSS